MFSVSDVLAKFLGPDRITAMAERVAGRSRMGVWQRVMNGLPTLRPTEAKGYLRARGISVVREETSRLVEQEGAAIVRHRDEIEESAMQLLVEMISAQIGQRATQGERRRAA
jgi:hypothetical protein